MAGNWTLMTNQPPNLPGGAFSSDSMILLTDGSVLVHNAYGKEWLRLTPDAQGNYSTGSWSAVINMIDTRQFFASGVAKDGRVFAIGGEYSDAGGDTPLGEIFDPNANTWSALNKPATFDFIHGDVASCILADGRVLCGSIDGPRTAIFDPIANTWTESGLSFGHSGQTKVGNTDEETWTLLPDNTVLTVEVYNPNAAEKYLPDQDQWVSAGSTGQPLPLASYAGVSVEEIGPALLLPNGKLFAIGATGHTALYTPPAKETDPGTWSNGPDFPLDAGHNILTAIDAPGCLLPNGKVLCVAGSTKQEKSSTGAISYWSNPTTFFEYDPGANTLTQIPQPSTNGNDTWTARLMLLPNGQALFTSQQNSIAVYTPDGGPNAAWRPVITANPSTVAPGGQYTLSGRQLNGLSQTVSYGDDYTAATNYPIIRLEQGSHVQYARTYGFSTRGVATGNTVASTSFEVLPGTPAGVNQLSVIANGIASSSVSVTVAGEVSYWMAPTPLKGSAGNWNRGADIFTAADVDGDKEVEIVVANNSDNWTGVLKWQGNALVPVWMSPTPLKGPGGNWNRGADIFTAADVDGDKEVEIVVANNSDNWTGVLKWKGGALVPVWMSPTPLKGPAGNWNRGADIFIAADVDGDGEVELVIANNSDNWTGVLKWQAGALVPVWMSPTPLKGPAGNWNRGADIFTAADVDGDGKVEIVLGNNSDNWTGVLKWQGGALVPVWMSASPLQGPAGKWNRGTDNLLAADVDGDGKVEIVVSNNSDGWTGVLKWNGTALVPIWMSASPITGPSGHWSRGTDTLTAADVDGDHCFEVFVANDTSGWTGVLKWNGAGLAPVWESASPVTGPAGNWNRGPDGFVSADVNADGHVEILIANNSNGWTGLLRWTP